MSTEVAFKAQPLNNEDISIIQLNGVILSKKEEKLRDTVNNKINKTSRLGSTIYKKDRIEILKYKSHIIIEIQTESFDSIQRRSPIICSTSLSQAIETPQIVLKHIKKFASDIDRAITPGNEQIIQALTSIKIHAKKTKTGLIDFIVYLIKELLSSLKK